MSLIDKNIRSGNKQVDDYIERLETMFNFSNLYRFIMAANEVAGVMADDMSKIAQGKKDKLKILSDDKDDKFTERLTTILKQVDVIKKISAEADLLIAAGKVEDPKKIKLESDSPAIEQLMQHAKKNKF
jgi:hypothetical protein